MIFKPDIEMSIIECCNCGVFFSTTAVYLEKKRKNHSDFYCPNGCKQGFLKETNEEWLKKRVALLNEDVRYLERSRNSYKGMVTKLQKGMK